MKYLFGLGFVLTLSLSSVLGQSWDDVKSGVLGAGCLLTVTPKLTQDCLNAFDREFDSRPKDERDSKTTCCAYLSLQSCVLDIAKKECNEEGESVAKSFLKTINRGITSDQCIDYGFITCITVTQIAIAAAIAVAILALISCICCCCCRSNRRRGRPV